MTNKIYLKRNTTAIIPIRVSGVDYNSLTKVVLGFKSCKHKDAPLLHTKTVNAAEGAFTETSENGFVINIILNTQETFKLKPGELFIDVYPVIGDTVINTGEPLRYEVIDTFLNEVIV